MWELWVHADHDHLHILLTSKWDEIQPRTNIFPGNNNPFSIKPAVTDGQDFWKKNINFSGLKSPYHRLVNRKKLILSLEKYFKTLKDMIIGTVGT